MAETGALLKETTMTGEEYREAIDTLKMTQVGSARFFGVAETTVRRWIAEQLDAPLAVVMLLKVMVHLGLTPNDVIDICGIHGKIDCTDGRRRVRVNRLP
jgi:recombinational DNA repair protein (RecF pathway)